MKEKDVLQGKRTAGPSCSFSAGINEMKVLLVLLIIVASWASAQQIGQNTSSTSGTYTLTAKSQLVIETVVVKDKQGKFISGLGAKDFTLTEDGAPQNIRFVEHQDLAAEQAPAPSQGPEN